MTLPELIAKLEQATGPDRELDAEIACAVRFPEHRPARKGDHAGVHGVDPESDWAGHIYVPTGFLVAYSYTRSIDDAMTLVPEGYIAVDMQMRDPTLNNSRNCAYVVPVNTNDVGWAKPKGHGLTKASLPLALCIAALRARAQDKQP